MMRPKSDAVTRVPHHLDVRMQAHQVFLSDLRIEGYSKLGLSPMQNVDLDASGCGFVKKTV